MAVKPGYKKTEFGGIPEDWDVSTFSDLFDITAGADFDPKRSHSFQSSIHPFPIYSNALTSSGLYGYCSYSDHPANSITVTARGMVGKANFRNHPYTAIGRVLVLMPKCEMAGFYFAQVINNSVKFANESTGVPQLTAPQISKYRLPVPPPHEQRAIATALSDVDALIGALERLLAKKRDLKQAAVQQLLTGQIRLPGFHSEWEMKRIGDIAPLQRGFDLPNPSLRPGPYPVVYSNGVMNYHAQAQVQGPGVITGRSGTIGSVTFVDGPFWPHNTALWVTSFKGNDPRYVFYLYTEINFERFATGSGVPTLNRNDVHSFEVEIPPYPEQIAIAAVLSDMDAELAALEQRLTKTRSLKQGVMQELLTGKTRLL
ncbi:MULTISPECIES: restriction endonuclease subunit S [unclassified Pseudomonas]|uniref:restriction endonuclease subunit S n=1 Tax=unclassified Pseudomonas TaxID=196821 RepID=UPI000A1DBA61|nr:MULTISPECIES: restriction endonuclease subunit S [unclassified Pseudomonas]